VRNPSSMDHSCHLSWGVAATWDLCVQCHIMDPREASSDESDDDTWISQDRRAYSRTKLNQNSTHSECTQGPTWKSTRWSWRTAGPPGVRPTSGFCQTNLWSVDLGIPRVISSFVQGSFLRFLSVLSFMLTLEHIILLLLSHFPRLGCRL
jgi:hypothetical protein